MPEFIEINLLPVEERKIKKDYTYLLDMRVVIPTLLLLTVLGLYVFGQQWIVNDLKEDQERLARINADIKEKEQILQDIKHLETLLQERNAKNRSLKSISLNKQLWVRILEGLSKHLPPNTWLVEIKQQNEQQSELTIKGTTWVFSEVAHYMMALEDDEYFLNIKLENIEVTSIGDVNAFVFNLKITINTGLGAETPVAQAPAVQS